MSERLLRHIVLFGFGDDFGGRTAQEVVARFLALRDTVPGIADFEWGTNISPERLNEQLTHCFTLTFRDDASRDRYLKHPEHVDFANWVGSRVARVTVVDYWTEAATTG